MKLFSGAPRFDSVIVMNEAAIERLRIAVRVLNLHFDHGDGDKVTEAEIEILKSYLGGDLANVAAEDIATAVIRRELSLGETSGRGRSKRRAHDGN
jgi:hypothetical protein